MSKIVKKMKIMQPGGTLSDYVPIGAEAENINVDGESVETKLGKKPYYYNTVADMKADTKLKVGDMAVTLGYYSVNDGGGAEYKIVNSNNIYHETLINGLFADLIIRESCVNVKQFGAKGDGLTDDILPLTNCLEYAISKHIKVKLLAETYYISTPIILNYPRDLTIEGTHSAFSTSSIIKSSTTCLKWCGARKCNIKGVYFIGEKGIQFYENDIDSQDSRTYNTFIEDCIFNCTVSGIDIETLNGYLYIKHNTFRVKERGIGLGINFTNTLGNTAPNYFYISENNFLNNNEVTTEKTKAIDVYYATYVFVDKNDIVTKYGIDFSNMDHVCSNFRIENNSFFENEYMIKADSNSYALKELLCVGNTFRLNELSYGIDVSSSNNQLFNFTGNYFEVGTGTITPLYIIKFNSSSTYGHVFEGNMAPNLANANVCALCTFSAAILRKMSQLYCQYISLNANSNNTYTLGSKYSWVKNRYASCTNPDISLATVANDNGSITITATNSTENQQRGILITSY